MRAQWTALDSGAVGPVAQPHVAMVRRNKLLWYPPRHNMVAQLALTNMAKPEARSVAINHAQSTAKENGVHMGHAQHHVEPVRKKGISRFLRHSNMEGRHAQAKTARSKARLAPCSHARSTARDNGANSACARQHAVMALRVAASLWCCHINMTAYHAQTRTARATNNLAISKHAAQHRHGITVRITNAMIHPQHFGG